MYEIPIRNWRVTASQAGADLWFEPSTECVKLFRTAPYEQLSLDSAWENDERVDLGGGWSYLDKVGSVSATEAEARVGSSEETEVIEPPSEWLSLMWEGSFDGS